MAHTAREKKKLLNRVRRIRGQVEAIERAIEQEDECSSILLTVAACRGAINGLMAEILEGHMRHHVLDSEGNSTPEQVGAAEEVIELIRRYLK
ncbi:MAG: metal/formaldehyde-sensitive transcriptional repressor [Planctomycetales bacterium]|nr:metal/formaldehyde-sensitive transcriptional repressor [Planctomycetales bacterium]